MAPHPPSRARFLTLKALGILLSILFFALAFLGIGYPVVTVLCGMKGVALKVTAFEKVPASHPLVFAHGGLYRLSLVDGKTPYAKALGVYPQWQAHWAPQKGDGVYAWPPLRPYFAAGATEGWGWLILGSVFILGLLFLEFAFLSLSLR